MTKDEVLALALEALELEDMACRYEKESTPEHIAKAITAIKQVLALDKMADNARDLGLDYEPHKGLSEHITQATNGRVCIDPVTGDVGIGSPPAQPAPVQEPVGVFVEDDDIGHVRLIPHQQLKLKDGDKLYTTPPNAATPLAAPAPEERKRQSAHSAWVGLAHEEIAEIVTPYWDKYCDFDFQQFTQDIEALLRSKNT